MSSSGWLVSAGRAVDLIAGLYEPSSQAKGYPNSEQALNGKEYSHNNQRHPIFNFVVSYVRSKPSQSDIVHRYEERKPLYPDLFLVVWPACSLEICQLQASLWFLLGELVSYLVAAEYM
jgi:hypothetical protein